jgi:long-chain acyl-CoA synthetase
MQGRPWLNRYDEGVPGTLEPYPARTLLDYLRDAAAQRPASPALLYKGRVVTNGELERQSDAFAAGLAALGVGRGDRVALLLPNCPQFMVAEFGAWKVGAVVAPLNPLYTERELEEALSRTEPCMMVTLTRFYERVKQVQPRTSLKHVVATNIKEYFPPVLRLLFTLLLERKEGDRVGLRDGDHRMTDLLRAPAAAPQRVAVLPADPAVLLMSGGTTGAAKAVLGAHSALVISGAQLRAWLTPILDEWQDRVMLPLPLFHVFAFAGVQSLALMGHNPLALVPNPRDIGDVVATIRRLRPSVFAGVPALFTALLEHPAARSGKADYSSIKGCFSGSAALLGETKRRFEALTGGVIVEGYSLTEVMMACVANPVRGEKKLGSVGIPLPDVEVCIVDADTGERDLGVGEVGEVLLRAPQMMQGYRGAPEETDLVLRSRGPGAPWLFTGDLGYLDADNVLFLVDRKKDLIKVSGMQVWPREIEEIIASHPAVAEVGVAGVPHERKGEVPRAWVVLRAGASADEQQIRDYCRASLAPFKVPASVVFRPALPRNLVGKVLRRELRAEAEAEADAARSLQPV